MNNHYNTCIIGIGSNIQAMPNIRKMLEILGSKVRIVKISSFVQTKPVGLTEQPDFTNGAIKIETNLTREELKSLLVSIENILGRDRNAPKFGPRTIDLDIVCWNGKTLDKDYYTRSYLKKSVEEIR